jgi:hypothetical protein
VAATSFYSSSGAYRTTVLGTETASLDRAIEAARRSRPNVPALAPTVWGTKHIWVAAHGTFSGDVTPDVAKAYVFPRWQFDEAKAKIRKLIADKQRGVLDTPERRAAWAVRLLGEINALLDALNLGPQVLIGAIGFGHATGGFASHAMRSRMPAVELRTRAYAFMARIGAPADVIASIPNTLRVGLSVSANQSYTVKILKAGLTNPRLIYGTGGRAEDTDGRRAAPNATAWFAHAHPNNQQAMLDLLQFWAEDLLDLDYVATIQRGLNYWVRRYIALEWGGKPMVSWEDAKAIRKGTKEANRSIAVAAATGLASTTVGFASANPAMILRGVTTVVGSLLATSPEWARLIEIIDEPLRRSFERANASMAQGSTADAVVRSVRAMRRLGDASGIDLGIRMPGDVQPAPPPPPLVTHGAPIVHDPGIEQREEESKFPWLAVGVVAGVLIVGGIVIRALRS